jgi:hypothetical protein
MGLYLFASIMIVLNVSAFGPDSLAKLTRKLFWRSSRARIELFPEPPVRKKEKKSFALAVQLALCADFLWNIGATRAKRS